MTEATAASTPASTAAPETGGASESEGNFQEASADEESVEESPKRKPPKMRKVKIYGNEEYVNEDEVFKDYQKYRAGEAKLKEAAQMRQSVEEFYRRLAEDPDSILRDPNLSLNRRELAEKWLHEALEEEFGEVDPREKEMTELQKRLAEYEKKEKQAKEQEEMQAREQFVESRKQAISQTLHEAMQSSHLASHPESKAAVLREMAVYMRAAKERGEEVTAQDLVEHVHNSRFQQFYTLAHQFQGNELLDFLGDEIVNRIRKADLERIRSKRNMPTQTFKNEIPFEKNGEQKFRNTSDVRWQWRNME